MSGRSKTSRSKCKLAKAKDNKDTFFSTRVPEAVNLT